MAGIYIHIPYCSKACHYCDFHFSLNRETKNALINAILLEIDSRNDYLSTREIKTIYFGGGTPSLLESNELDLIIKKIHQNFSVHSDCEITLEANPDDLTPQKTKELSFIGINRLSIGIQSFNDKVLNFLNRSHNSDKAKSALKNSLDAGIENLSLDLIYGIPGQDQSVWEADIDTALSFSSAHISSYCLTIEKGTYFGNLLRKGRMKLIDDESALLHFKILIDRLTNSGYEHYEISNFAQPGFISQHNSSYWLGEEYLGLGPSAHSFNKYSRQYNIDSNVRYIKGITEGHPEITFEQLSEQDKINEYFLTRLRTKWGCSLQDLKHFKSFSVKRYEQVIEKNLALDLIKITDETIFLTHKGKFLADRITEDFFII